MRRSFPWVVALALVAAAAWADAQPAALDGSVWHVRVQPDGLAQKSGEKEFDETLSFQAGKIVTSTASRRGFESAPYVAARSGDSDWSFSADQKGASGTFGWSGTAHGDDLRGKLVWTKPDRSVWTYTFHGDKKK